jgi:stress response protein YsnF
VEADEEEALPPAETAAAGTLELVDDEEVIRIPMLAEQVVIHRRPFISEEVVIRKRRVPESQEVQGQVRREELEIEAEGATVEREGGEAVIRPSPAVGGESLPARRSRSRTRAERQERR